MPLHPQLLSWVHAQAAPQVHLQSILLSGVAKHAKLYPSMLFVPVPLLLQLRWNNGRGLRTERRIVHNGSNSSHGTSETFTHGLLEMIKIFPRI